MRLEAHIAPCYKRPELAEKRVLRPLPVASQSSPRLVTWRPFCRVGDAICFIPGANVRSRGVWSLSSRHLGRQLVVKGDVGVRYKNRGTPPPSPFFSPQPRPQRILQIQHLTHTARPPHLVAATYTSDVLLSIGPSFPTQRAHRQSVPRVAAACLYPNNISTKSTCLAKLSTQATRCTHDPEITSRTNATASTARWRKRTVRRRSRASSPRLPR